MSLLKGSGILVPSVWLSARCAVKEITDCIGRAICE